MSWSEILKKNNKDFEVKEINIIDNNFNECIKDNLKDNLRDTDEEFERIYFSKITDIKIELSEYIRGECLPFLNKLHLDSDYTFHDYIKYNCKNLHKLEEKINKDNTEYLEELKKEEEEENNYYDT
jgi:hypothetical protein